MTRVRTAGGPARLAGAGLVVAAALAVAGCQADPGSTTPTETPEVTATSEAPSPTPDAADPAGLLAHYGLELPEGADDVVAEAREDDVMTDSFLVTFTAPADDVAQMCADAGIGDPLVAAALSETQRTELEVDGPPEGAQLCSASNPDDMAQQIRVLFHGDPATVRVAVFTMPSR